MRFLQLNGLGAIVLVAGLLQGCATQLPITFAVDVDTPEPSQHAYVSADQDQPRSLAFSHQIPAGQVQANGPVLAYKFQQEKKDIDTPKFFTDALSRELKARELPVDLNGTADDQIQLLSYESISHRNNGFSPLVMIAMVKLNLIENGTNHRIAAMIKRAKVPVWTVVESRLVEATINQPQELLVKEVASKVNLALFKNRLADEQVDALIDSVRGNAGNAGDEDLAYQQVYELGFSNNPRALPALREFSASEAEYIRLAAISGMGMLGSEAVLDELKALYQSGKLWQDRAVALKAIGDINSPDALVFLKQEQQKWQGQTSQEAVWNSKLIALYLD